jgi:RimJ/RimL family protein N-acetyltransferase
VYLRDVRLDDVDVYVRLRCDPAMMAELGGPLPREGLEAKIRSDVEAVARDEAWICLVVPDERDPGTVAGSVVLWSHEGNGDGGGGGPMSETGWMVLPEFQGRGLAKAATRLLLERARDDGRWGVVHAFPGVRNGPSNGICRSLGFRLVGEETIDFAGRQLRTNHWLIDPRTDLVPADPH